MSMTYGMLCDALSLRRKPPGHGVFFKRAAARLVRRVAVMFFIEGRTPSTLLPRPRQKTYTSEGEVPELPLAPHLQAAVAEAQERTIDAEIARFFAEQTPLVNARREEESYWVGVTDVDEQLWVTELLRIPGSLFAPSCERGRKELEE